MACDATARLYDVDEDSVVFERLKQTNKYDQGTITFQARQGALINLDKLHESLWATRFSDGTSSGVVSLEVNAVGTVVQNDDATILKVDQSEATFVLVLHSDKKHVGEFAKLKAAKDEPKLVRVTGQIDKYVGKWPEVLKTKPKNPRRILITKVQTVE